MISQNATSTPGRGGRRKLPWAFTEHGAIQAANVLNSSRAIAMGVYVVRAFVQLPPLLASNKDLAQRLDQIEARLDKKLTTHDEAIAAILSSIRQRMNPPAPKRRGCVYLLWTAALLTPKPPQLMVLNEPQSSRNRACIRIYCQPLRGSLGWQPSKHR